MWPTTIFSALLFLAFIGSNSAQDKPSKQKYTISGYIEDALSGEKLIGATIADPQSGMGAVSNIYGFYSLTLPANDSLYLLVSYIGYQRQIYKVILDKNTELDIALSEELEQEAVVVSAEEHREAIEDRVQMSQVSIPIEQIKKLPAFLGEVDVLKALQLLPGVQSGSEGSSGLYVRGGSPDQNLILLDGVPVYNAFHLFGFFSVFNADAIKSVTLTKGGYPARFGGRLSSVLEINMKEGNMNKFHGEGSIGLISSKFTLEGPIWKEHTSFIVSARRTYIDVLAQPFILLAQSNTPGESAVPGYYFYDVNAKINHRFNRKHRLYASFYTGDDKFSFVYKSKFKQGNYEEQSEYRNGLQWGNITSALRWNWLISDKLFANTTLTYSRYNFNISILDKTTVKDNDSTYIYNFGAKYLSGIEDLGFKMDFDYVPHPNHYIRFGANGIYHVFKPGAINVKTDNDQIDNDQSYGNRPIKAGEFYAYMEDDFKIGKIFRANIGLHASGFLVNEKFYHSLQPRVGTRIMLPERIALKASFATMTQYIHLLSNEGIGLPTDLWVPTTDSIVPEQSWQLALGIAKTFEGLFELSIEGFYRDMRGLISYKPGASFIEPGSSWQSKVETNGLGQSYGAEIFLQRSEGKFTGWVGYTLSWSWRHFPDTDINSGKKYPYKYDRRHDVAIAAMYKFSERVSASAVWVFGTGNTTTLPIERYAMPNRGYLSQFETYSAKNDYRMRPYHRLDLSVDLHYKRKKWEYSWSFGVYNAYSRQNPFFIFADTDWRSGQRVFKQVSLFPIIPSVRWNFKF